MWALHPQMSPGAGEAHLSKEQGAPGSGAAAAPAAPCFPSSLTGEKAAPPSAGQFKAAFKELVPSAQPISPLGYILHVCLLLYVKQYTPFKLKIIVFEQKYQRKGSLTYSTKK